MDTVLYPYNNGDNAFVIKGRGLLTMFNKRLLFAGCGGFSTASEADALSSDLIVKPLAELKRVKRELD
jgi:hypothetical protein